MIATDFASLASAPEAASPAVMAPEAGSPAVMAPEAGWLAVMAPEAASPAVMAPEAGSPVVAASDAGGPAVVARPALVAQDFPPAVMVEDFWAVIAGDVVPPVVGLKTVRCAEPNSWRRRVERLIPRSWISTKRAMDIGLALVGLTLSAPLLLVAMLAIVIASPGSPIFAQERVGRYGRRFTMYKLRSMKPNAHAQQAALRVTNEVSGPVFKMKSDPRVFPLGRILRKLSIDELPNLVNVLLGDMSIVGPRPALPSEVEHHDDLALGRLRAKPGITCVWQVSGRSNVSFAEWMRLDEVYVDNWSPLYDLKIILSTIPAVLFSKGAY